MLIAGLLTAICLLVIYACNWYIDKEAEGKMYADAVTIPYKKTGLLLGTSKLLQNGRQNPYYVYRVMAAAELLKMQKIKYLVISGDNGRNTYNEPADMRADLISAGVDSTRIYPDYAGFRTFDSVVRLKKIFGQDSVTIFSQPFHNERALYIAGREGMHAIAFNAKDVRPRMPRRTLLREKLARVKVVLDFWWNKKPGFLGAKIPIPA